MIILGRTIPVEAKRGIAYDPDDGTALFSAIKIGEEVHDALAWRFKRSHDVSNEVVFK